ncbi:hypothetical protein APHAL10511_008389 [Amanita phalloides]|nr:hypothetical protein APHAL10511_008389 [Amanita phalloides]
MFEPEASHSLNDAMNRCCNLADLGPLRRCRHEISESMYIRNLLLVLYFLWAPVQTEATSMTNTKHINADLARRTASDATYQLHVTQVLNIMIIDLGKNYAHLDSTHPCTRPCDDEFYGWHPPPSQWYLKPWEWKSCFYICMLAQELGRGFTGTGELDHHKLHQVVGHLHTPTLQSLHIEDQCGSHCYRACWNPHFSPQTSIFSQNNFKATVVSPVKFSKNTAGVSRCRKPVCDSFQSA